MSIKEKISNVFEKPLNKLNEVLTKVKEKLSDFNEYKIKPVKYKVIDFCKKYLGINWLGKKWQKVSNKAKKAICGYLFILPFIVGLIVFGMQPIGKSIRMAFAEVAATKVINEVPVFVIEGLSFIQFTKIFSENPTHVEAIFSVLGDVLIVVPLVLVFSLILSLLLNRKIKGVKIFRMIFFIPVILLSGNLISYFQSYNLLVVPGIEGGAVEGLLTFYLPEEISDIIMQAFSKVVLILWLSGVQTLIFLAGLQKTNKPVYEAAAIDGATKWESFWKITFPSLLPLMMINIVYTTVIYSSLGNELTAIISQATVSPEFGRDYASALSWILFGIELVVIGVYMLILNIANKRYQ